MILSLFSALGDFGGKIFLILLAVLGFNMFAGYISYIAVVFGYIVGIYHFVFSFIDKMFFPVMGFTYYAYGSIIFVILFKLFMTYIISTGND